MAARILVVGLCALALLALPGCQMTYYMHGAYHQVAILNHRVPIEKILRSQRYDESTKSKLRLVMQVREFAKSQLGFDVGDLYSTYVQLDRPAVSYVVQVAPRDQLEHYLWNFPFVGSVPYKGYFNLQLAQEEAQRFPADQYDTYVRGVSAYSTLGWFNDPIVSPMLAYADHDLVEVVIHELVHTNVYIKSNADFNERLATFVGRMGMVQFYQSLEGVDGKTLQQVRSETHDQKVFSEFISKELADLKVWYQQQSKPLDEALKTRRLRDIQDRFSNGIAPKLKSDALNEFPRLKLNNALLLTYQTYVADLGELEKQYTQLMAGVCRGLPMSCFLKEIKKQFH